VTFAIGADAYDRYMGRYSRELAAKMVAFAGVEEAMRALDVGCGPGSLTETLAARVGAKRVAAADPSESFVSACRERVSQADVRVASAEALPWPDESFDAVLSQLVLNFMRDARAGVSEMKRVARRGGVVASATWDYSDGMRMLRVFFDSALVLDPEAPDEGKTMRFQDPESLASLWQELGFDSVETAALEVEGAYTSFDDYWNPFTEGVGPGGSYCASLTPDHRAALREECRKRLGDPREPFVLSARAWAVRGWA
jgi:ubiquinone/menaquinone biosynthesis C-methylase UbiE